MSILEKMACRLIILFQHMKKLRTRASSTNLRVHKTRQAEMEHMHHHFRKSLYSVMGKVFTLVSNVNFWPLVGQSSVTI